MSWIYKTGMAVAVIGAALVTGGILPIGFAGVATAIGVAAGYFHEAPTRTPKV